MTVPDAPYAALIASCLLVNSRVIWPAFVTRSGVDPARARVWLWSTVMSFLWLLVAAGVVLWEVERRPWAQLRLLLPHGVRAYVAIALIVAVAAFHVRAAMVLTRKKRSAGIRLPDHARLMTPHTKRELVWFAALSLSAGVCEEFVFRGYLIWLFQPMLGLWGAAAASLVIFAAAHSYQGVKGVMAVGVVGLLLTVVVLASGSLIPAMALHALIDAGQGTMAWILSGVQSRADATPHSSGVIGGTSCMPE